MRTPSTDKDARELGNPINALTQAPCFRLELQVTNLARCQILKILSVLAAHRKGSVQETAGLQTRLFVRR